MLRPAPAPLIAFLAANRQAVRADLITVTLVDGTTKYRWTTAPYDLTVSAVTYSSARGAAGPLITRAGYRQSGRLAVDTLDVVLDGTGFTIGGRTLGALAVSGYFDGARIQIDHLVMASPGDISLGPLVSMFEGRVNAEPRGRDVVLRCTSELIALNVMTPQFVIAPKCGNQVYDANCALSKAGFTLAGTVSGSTTKTITTASAALTAKAAGYFVLGTLSFTSGALAGVKRAVSAWTGTVFTLSIPLASTPANGDAFTVYPGCDGKRATCADATKFNNLTHYRGYPHAPAAEGGSR
jgi:uncharacterized phage protein (TIGR02218 family)